MKVTVEKTCIDNQVKKYPWVGTHIKSHHIILFTSYRCGVTLESSFFTSGTYHNNNILEDDFEVFKGKITIEN